MAFEVYQPNSRTTSNKEEVRISKNGFITISAKLSESFLANSSCVQMLFDPESQRIAIKPAERAAGNTLKISSQSGSRSKRVAARGFVDFCGFQVGKSVVVPASWENELGAIVFTVPKG